ncbi:efflux RND transporter periplasmic adaptor subunit [Chitinophaga pendula]|uniref:efflux RND transporter periplasmic adaptor subunit n=1 Tax=Chitinophaga TaxID=79328 RepID=UPI000BAF4F53|nr:MULTISPECIES: efflux RND transporter periplasmic adaptor subunit [Chitinophaga]ASZ15116.1 efflux transporter periplasmic adaptor subunit [Chitinophaga sp. MD30]UCJ08252.1 efflux RND transporter periplasmic adaptor subunit [Chitinophaga pendula]
MKKSTTFAMTAVGFMYLLFVYACGVKGQPDAAAAAGPADYPVMTVTTQAVTLQHDYPATLQGEQNIEIRPKVDGFVAHIYVDEGAVVKKGQLLFKIHGPQYEQEVRTATAAIKRAQADVHTAGMQVEKTAPLVEEGIISNYELQSAKYTLQAREAALAQAKASLVNANTNIGYTTISSPVDGIVGSLPYKPGSLVSSSSPLPLTVVSNTHKIHAYFAFNEKELLDLTARYPGKTIAEKLAQLPEVLLLLANGTEYTGKGRIETVTGQIDVNTGAANMRAAFTNPEGLIRSGASATIRIPMLRKEALLIPKKASFEIQEKTFVYVVDSKNAVKSVEVTLEEMPGGQYNIVKTGLKAGDRIVTQGMGALQDNMQIKPVAAQL